jgi:Asparagine synthase (glutamine-hydrolyzing)
MTIRKFWDCEAPKIAGPKNLTAPKMELDEILQEAIKHQMISDVPLGAFLSGGIDSSFIVAAMSRASEEPVKTFTIGFTKMGYYDERSHAARVASLFHTEHHEFVVDQGVPEILPRLVSIFDEPFADSSAIPTLCLAELARKYVTVALSGTGGDEIFGGYRKYMAARWVALYSSLPSSLRATFQKTSSLLPASRLSLWKERALLFQRFTGLNSEKPLYIQLNEIFSPTEVADMLGSPAAEIEFRLSGKTVVEEMMAFDYANYLPEDLLVKEDRCTMAFGLEARVPLLDRTVVEFMNARPVKDKVLRTGSKILFKKVAAKYLPADIIKRPKHGFGSPVAEWLRGDLRELAEGLLLSSRSFLSREAAKPLFAAHIGGADHSKKLWALLMLELWYAESLR